MPRYKTVLWYTNIKVQLSYSNKLHYTSAKNGISNGKYMRITNWVSLQIHSSFGKTSPVAELPAAKSCLPAQFVLFDSYLKCMLRFVLGSGWNSHRIWIPPPFFFLSWNTLLGILMVKNSVQCTGFSYNRPSFVKYYTEVSALSFSQL